MQGKQLQTKEFSTTGLPPLERFERWHDFSCDAYSKTAIRDRPERAFDARFKLRNFGALEFGDLSVRTPIPVHLSRTAAEIRRDNCANYVCMLVLDGKKYFNQREKSVEIRPGDIILYDQASPFEVKISENYRAVAVTMPRDLIDKHQIDVNSFVCRPISSNNYFGKLIKNLFYKSMNHDISMHNNIDHRINNLLLDIIELNFITQDDYDENGGPSKSLNDAKSIMSMNISDPDFNVSDICKSLKVSARTLNRWFAGDGTTPMRWLREQRLAGSHRALVEGRASNVTAAAMNFGFNDLSHYSHIFKERYGYPPSALIRQPRGRSD